MDIDSCCPPSLNNGAGSSADARVAFSVKADADADADPAAARCRGCSEMNEQDDDWDVGLMVLGFIFTAMYF